MVRTLLFLGILIAMFIGAELVAFVLFLYSLIRYSGFELVVIGILLDGYSGAFYHVPYLTISLFIVWLLVDALKQELLLYTKNDATVS